MVNPAEASRLYRAGTDLRQKSERAARVAAVPPSPPTSPPPGAEDSSVGVALPLEDRNAARTRREIAEANLAEMEEAEARGDLKRAAEVRRELAKLLTGLREALLQIPSRIGPLVAAEMDQRRVIALIDVEIRQALLQATEGEAA